MYKTMGKKKFKLTYPAYFDVDDVPVKLELIGKGENEEVVGSLANGKPYPIGKAIVDGFKITKKEYDKLAKALYGDNVV